VSTRRSIAISLLAASLVVVSSGQVRAENPISETGTIRFDPRREHGRTRQSVSLPRNDDVLVDEDVSTAIVGGWDVEIIDVPWQVLLVDLDPLYWQAEIGQDFLPSCGGSIIDSLWILTAAHCVDIVDLYPTLRVVAGVTRLSEIEEVDFLEVAEVLVHERYRWGSWESDIALVKLVEPLNMNGTTIRAIDLPLSSQSSWPESGTSAFTSGWGDLQFGGTWPDVLQGADIQVLSSPSSRRCGEYSGVYDRRLMLCAGVPSGEQDSCTGDSGGPLVIEDNEVPLLAGITSWGFECGRAGFPGVYTRVTTYLSWIQGRMSGSDEPIEFDLSDQFLDTVTPSIDLEWYSARSRTQSLPDTR
jgi:secreted trypsin-like serine protease